MSNKDVGTSPPKHKRSSKDPKYVRNKRELRDYETFQQAILLGLLNQFCAITIKRPRKQTTVTTKNHVLVDLIFDKEKLEIAKLTEENCKPKYLSDIKAGMNVPAAFRRLDKNKRIYAQNLLIDICVEKGYFFNSKLARKSKKNLRLERIESIYFKSNYQMGLEDIINRGKCLNNYFCSLVEKEKKYTLTKNDEFITKLLDIPLQDLPKD
ncbi:hypothetical protein QTN25_001917 [Entamoeba marina]